MVYQHGPEPFPVKSDEFRPPKLFVEWSSWPRVFLGNLRDLVFSPSRDASSPDTALGTFWPDVFVSRRMPLAPFRQSALYHLFAVVAIWGLSHAWMNRPRIKPLDPFENSKIVYYPISSYLPALRDEAETEPSKVETKGQPAYARQRIRSVPLRPDNTRQTIVTPSPLTIHKDLALPNLVAWSPAEVPLPLAAATGMRSTLTAPSIPGPIPPPPQVLRKQLTTPGWSAPEAIAPPPTVNLARTVPALPAPAPVPPAPSLQRRLGDLNIAPMAPSVTAPRLPVVAQSAVPVRGVGPRRVSAGGSSLPTPPSPLASIGTSGRQDMGRLIALGSHPAAPGIPILAPQGNRRGSFAVGPDGKPGAPGTPDRHGSGKDGGTGGNANGVQSPVPGLMVEKAEIAAIRPSTRATPRNLFSQKLARASDIPPFSRPVRPSGSEPKIEDLGTGPKKYYAMTLNMPNLTSAEGSWVIRFAEMQETRDESPVTAPVPTLKVDPAYPAELLRNRVEGVVTLCAIIRADGAVSSVRVLRGVDARLDASARAALQKWHFRPGSKHGAPVDLEAVVQIPFVARRAF